MEIEYSRMKSLLEKVKQIITKHEEIAHLKGENFNVFRILDKSTDEVRTHSALIAELLNPKGSHGMGDTFLRFFIDVVNRKLNSESETENNRRQFISKSKLETTQVYAEYNIGKVTETSGGQIDILLSNDEFIICIENKINAGDQDYQLIRYHDYLRKQPKKYQILFYLTLEGAKASDKSTQYSNPKNQKIELIDEKNYYCLSYRNDILIWLEKCYHYSIELPVLRESIKQYINLIKNLTHQLISHEMEKEVYKAILEEVDSAEKIKDNFDYAIQYYSERLKQEIIDKLKSKYPGVIIETKDNKSFSNIFVWFPNKKVHFGIESFNNYSLFNSSTHQKKQKHLVIGYVDWKGINSEHNISYGIWLKDFPQKNICTKSELFENLRQYSSNDENIKASIVDFFIREITTYIDDNLNN